MNFLGNRIATAVLAAALVVLLVVFGVVEVKHGIATHEIKAQLQAELDCSKNSACERRAVADRAAGLAAVDKARKDEAAKAATQLAALRVQTEGALAELKGRLSLAEIHNEAFRKKLSEIAKQPACSAWLKEPVACDIQ